MLFGILLLYCFTAWATPSLAHDTDRVIVKQSSRNNDVTIVDVGPAIPSVLDNEPDQAGLHGEVLSCNNDQASCYRPYAGTEGKIVSGDASEDIYDNENVHILWPGARATYALRESY